jgi:hypothetical protein
MALNIPAIAREGARIGFELADSVMTDAVLYIRPGAGTPGSYDPDTDQPETDTVASYNVRGLQYQSASQKNADDSANTSSFLVRVDELSDQGLTETPNDADYLMIGGIRWNVVRVDPDPSMAVYIFQMRRA